MATTEKVTAKVTEQAEKKVQEMEAAKVARSMEAQEAPEEADALSEDNPEEPFIEDDLSDMEETNLFVTRKRFVTKDKKNQYWGYHVAGTVRGRNVEVSLKATDAGGYEVIDIVFGAEKQVPLYRVPYTIKDDKGNVTMSGYRYYAVTVDEEGSYQALVKPSRKSDGALLEMMIKDQMRRINKLSGGDRIASEG